ncbi:MAG: CPBP family intramembrane metalloprotease [Propionibacteriaceae bacterium]|nr:CPBP family intramembrane metalloprotease [Propionibacteriaceae bacterium]
MGNQNYHAPQPGPPSPIILGKPPQNEPNLPTQLKDYFGFFAVPTRTLTWAYIAILVSAGLWLSLTIVSGFIDVITYFLVVFTRREAIDSPEILLPAEFLIYNLFSAASIPVAVVVAWLFYKQGFGWLSSVVGRFRWKWFGTTLGIFAFGYLAMKVGEILTLGPSNVDLNDLAIWPYTGFMIVVILLTTPLQSAGEEYLWRALMPRLISALIPVRSVGLIFSALVSSGLFMWAHYVSDLWSNLYYFGLGLVLWWLCYRTGGLEASVALHITVNVVEMWFLPFSDLAAMIDSSDGLTGSPALMLYLAVQVVLALIIDWLARRRGLVRMASPSAPIPHVVKAKTLVLNLAAAEPATEADLPRLASTPRETPGFTSQTDIPQTSGESH